MNDNPIKNPAQAKTAQHFKEYLAVKIQSKAVSEEDKNTLRDQLAELTEQLDDYNENIALRLVVNNKD